MSVITSRTVSIAPDSTSLRSSSDVTALAPPVVDRPFIYSWCHGSQPAADRNLRLRGAGGLLALDGCDQCDDPVGLHAIGARRRRRAPGAAAVRGQRRAPRPA